MFESSFACVCEQLDQQNPFVQSLSNPFSTPMSHLSTYITKIVLVWHRPVSNQHRFVIYWSSPSKYCTSLQLCCRNILHSFWLVLPNIEQSAFSGGLHVDIEASQQPRTIFWWLGRKSAFVHLSYSIVWELTAATSRKICSHNSSAYLLFILWTLMGSAQSCNSCDRDRPMVPFHVDLRP